MRKTKENQKLSSNVKLHHINNIINSEYSSEILKMKDSNIQLTYLKKKESPEKFHSEYDVMSEWEEEHNKELPCIFQFSNIRNPMEEEEKLFFKYMYYML